MEDEGEDLVHIELTKTGDTYEMTSTIIANGFISPVDAEIVEDKIYILEHRGNGLNNDEKTQIWEIDFNGTTTSIEEYGNELAKHFQLNQNYPNPFNPTTNISFELPKSGEVSLKVFDMLGREVQELINGYQAAGAHQVQFNAENLPSGMYIYRLKSGSVELTRKMMLIK